MVFDWFTTVSSGFDLWNPSSRIIIIENRSYEDYGQREFAWGRTYFTRNVPIDYGKGHFVFVETDAKGKK